MRPRRAVTILESLLAITLTGVGLLAIVGVGTDARRRRARADLAVAAAGSAADRARTLTGGACALAAAGTDDSAGLVRAWSTSRGPRGLLLVRASARPIAGPADSAVVSASRWCE